MISGFLKQFLGLSTPARPADPRKAKSDRSLSGVSPSRPSGAQPTGNVTEKPNPKPL
jgi:hypothetical protein